MPVPKWMTGTPGVSRWITLRDVRQHVIAVVGGRERPDPGVEELDGLRAGLDLSVQVRHGDVARARP